MSTKIGSKLKDLRGKKTLREVAGDLGISTSALGMYESGLRIPRDPIKKKIADYFNTTVDAIFFSS